MDNIFHLLMLVFERFQKFRTVSFNGLVSLLLLTRSFTAAVPITCTSNPSITTLAALIDCLDAYTVTHDFYKSETAYNAAQPTPTELTAWQTAVSSLLAVDGNCASLTVPSAISADYRISLFTESSGSSYCVLSELTATSSVYTRGWGHLVVPATRAGVRRHVHFSAPHPRADFRTPQQAAALFHAIGAKSLLIPGRNRTANFNQTDCIKSSVDTYYKTDPAHDKNQPFYTASMAIRDWQQSVGGCPSATCAFIQMHGKGTKTCPEDDVFMSSGLGTGNPWYTDSIDRPIKRLQTQLRTVVPTWVISLPTDSTCGLAAVTNIVGRRLNGISDDQVCGPKATTATGEFIHIEQASAVRDPSVYASWATALEATFSPV